jgi:hypothetical protein
MLSKGTWAAIVIGLGACLWLARPQMDTRVAPPVPVAPVVPVVPLAPSVPPAPPAAAAGVPAQPGPAAPLLWPLDSLKQFNASQNYRTFVFDASRKPGPTWYQYAHAAMAYCARGDADIPDLKADPRRGDALAALRQRCDMSAAERSAAQHQLFARRGDSDRGDPVMDASLAWLVPESAQDERQALGILLQTADPLVLEMLAEPSRARKDGKTGLGTWFMGRYYDSGKGSDFDLAFHLALCDLGADCGAQAPPTLLLCIERGWCADSYGAALRSGRPGEAGAIDALAAQISTQLRARNVGAFAEHK